jgi:hypothetical protein
MNLNLFGLQAGHRGSRSPVWRLELRAGPNLTTV